MLALHDAQTCPCGCGQWVKECLNPDSEARWQVTAERCYARAALTEHAKQDGDPPSGQLLSMRLLSDGEVTELEFDPDRALAEYEAHQARHQNPDQ